MSYLVHDKAGGCSWKGFVAVKEMRTADEQLTSDAVVLTTTICGDGGGLNPRYLCG